MDNLENDGVNLRIKPGYHNQTGKNKPINNLKRFKARVMKPTQREVTRNEPCPPGPGAGRSVWNRYKYGESPTPTPRRNDPCPCGSGVKYKKCCLIKTD